MEPIDKERIAKFEMQQREEVYEKHDSLYWRQRCINAEYESKVLQKRVTRLLKVLNKIFISGTPDDEAWQIVVSALVSDNEDDN